MSEEYREALLEEEEKRSFYVAGCPGCEVDMRKKATSGLPVKDLMFMWFVVLCNALPISSLYPFLYFMIRDFHVAKRDEDIGYYAGYVGSALMLGRILTSVLWGVAADRYGRKPVILFGLVSVIIFNTMFGFSVNLWMAVGSRFFLGLTNGIIGPVKAYATEIFREEHQSVGLSVVSSAWAIGLIIGPALGGFLSQPVDKYPDIFAKNSIFGRFPYFLPCFCISIFAVGGLAAALYLPETLHMHKESESYDDLRLLEAPCESDVPSEKNYGRNSNSWKSLLQNWPLISSIIIYCVFSLHDSAYTEIFSLWAVSPKRLGGLSLTTQDVGLVLGATGVGIFVFQLTVYPYVERRLGAVKFCRLASALSILLLSCYPLISSLDGTILTVALNAASVAKSILFTSIITCVFILQNRAVEQHQRGAANGIAMTSMSLFKAIGPAGGGAIFSMGQKRQDAAFLPGNQLVFFALNVVQLMGLVLTFKPFLAY